MQQPFRERLETTRAPRRRHDARPGLLILQASSLPLQDRQGGSDAGQVLRAVGEGLDQASNLPADLGELSLDGRGGFGGRLRGLEELGEPAGQGRAVEHLLKALLDSVQHGLIEVGLRNPEVVTDGGAGVVVAAAEIVGDLATPCLLVGAEALPAVGALDEAAQEVRPVPGAPDAEASRPVARLRGRPEGLGHDRRHRARDGHPFGRRPADLAPLLPDLGVARFRVAQRARVERVAKDRPERALCPGRGPPPRHGGRGGDAVDVQAMGERSQADPLVRIGVVEIPDHGGLNRLHDEHHGLAPRLPSAGGQEAGGAVGLTHGPPVPVGRDPAGPMPPLGVGPKPPRHDLAELLGVVMGEDTLERLHEVPRDAALVRAGLVGVEHADPGPPERVLVETGFLRVEPAETAHVVTEHRGRVPLVGTGTDLQESQELPPARRVQPARVVRELPDDRVAVLGGPGADSLALLLDRQVLVGPGASVERVGGRGHPAVGAAWVLLVVPHEQTGEEVVDALDVHRCLDDLVNELEHGWSGWGRSHVLEEGSEWAYRVSW